MVAVIGSFNNMARIATAAIFSVVNDKAWLPLVAMSIVKHCQLYSSKGTAQLLIPSTLC